MEGSGYVVKRIDSAHFEDKAGTPGGPDDNLTMPQMMVADEYNSMNLCFFLAGSSGSWAL
jgi:hypothetical protein